MSDFEQTTGDEKEQEKVHVTREEYSQIYEVGKSSLETWKATFEELVQKNQQKINWFFEKTAFLYGAEKPENLKIALVFNPNKGNEKGEPINNFTEIDPDLEHQADVVYWVPLPEDYMVKEEHVQNMIKGIIHEGEHRCFQGNRGNFEGKDFNTFIAGMDKDEEIALLREKLFGTDTGYLEPTNELLTVYLENAFDLAPFENETGNTNLEFDISEEMSFRIILAAMYYQERDYADAPTLKGPYANIKKGYRELSATILNKKVKINTDPPVDESTGGAVAGKMKVSPYNFRGKLSSDLLKEYIDQNKIIDRKFIVSLYKLAINSQDRGAE